eukprot:scaffold16967_cov113-Isochrysis_galbana.AAC.3
MLLKKLLPLPIRLQVSQARSVGLESPVPARSPASTDHDALLPPLGKLPLRPSLHKHPVHQLDKNLVLNEQLRELVHIDRHVGRRCHGPAALSRPLSAALNGHEALAQRLGFVRFEPDPNRRSQELAQIDPSRPVEVDLPKDLHDVGAVQVDLRPPAGPAGRLLVRRDQAEHLRPLPSRGVRVVQLKHPAKVEKGWAGLDGSRLQDGHRHAAVEGQLVQLVQADHLAPPGGVACAYIVRRRAPHRLSLRDPDGASPRPRIARVCTLNAFPRRWRAQRVRFRS